MLGGRACARLERAERVEEKLHGVNERRSRADLGDHVGLAERAEGERAGAVEHFEQHARLPWVGVPAFGVEHAHALRVFSRHLLNTGTPSRTGLVSVGDQRSSW